MARTKDLVNEFLRESETAQRRRLRRTRIIVAAVLAVVTGLAGVAILFAVQNRQRADDLEIAQAETARERDLSNAMGIARLAEADAYQDPARGVRFALTVLDQSPDLALTEPINALRRNLAARPSRYLLRPWEWQPIEAVAFSPDARYLVAGSSGGLALWEITEGAVGPGLRSPEAQILEGWDSITSLAFYPGIDPILLAAGTPGGVQLGYLTSPPGPLPGAAEIVWSLAWSPNGAFLASGNEGGIVQVWESPPPNTPWPEPRRLSVEDGATSNVSTLDFGPDGRYLAAAGGRRITVWHTADLGQALHVLECGDLSWVDWLQFSDREIGTLYAGSTDGLFSWDVTQAQPQCEPIPVGLLVEGAATQAQVASIDPDERWVAFTASDNVVRIFDEFAERVLALRGHAFAVTATAFSPPHLELFVTGSQDTSLRLWDLKIERMEPRVLWDFGATTLAFDQAGQLWAAGARLESFAVWQPGDPEHTARPLLEAPAGELEGISRLGRDAQWAAFFRQDGRLSVWELEAATGQSAYEFTLAPSYVWSLSPDGGTLALGNEAGEVHLWHPGDPPKEAGTLPCPLEYGCWVTALAWSPDGANLAYHYAGGTVGLWNPQQQTTQNLEPGGGRENSFASLLFSSDGQMLAAGTEQDEVHLWHLDNPAAPSRLLAGPRHMGSSITSLAFSPDGVSLAAGGSQGTIRLWDLGHPERQPQILEGHTDIITSLTFDRAGQLASASYDGTVRIWRTKPQDLVDFAEQRVHRPPLFEGEFEGFLAPFTPEMGNEPGP